MHRRLYKYTSPLILLVTTSGCVQMTRHSNMMLFGTNTVVGLRVGTSAGQVPSVDFGYTRQEAVVMPLLANTRESSDRHANQLSPCNVGTPVAAADGSDRTAIHPCLFVGTNGAARDTYSVLGTFGAHFQGDSQGGTTPGGRATASGGLAQYFATGIAAQILAATGGAALVATGPAATASAIATASGATRQTLQALYGNDPSFVEGGPVNDAYTRFRTNLLARVQLTDPAQLQARITAFQTAAHATISIAGRCTTVAQCQAAILEDAFLLDFQDPAAPAAFDAALRAWAI
jgi:hypothetical protein